MKQFPVQMQQQNTMIVPQTLNTNTSLYENETNGRLNGQNIAVDSINYSHFKPVDVSTVNSGKIITTKFKGATQQYQSVSRYNKDFGGDIFAYILAADLITIDWNKGWNYLTSLSNFEELIVDMDCKEGMLSGFFQVNFRHGINVVAYQPEETILYAETSYDWWTRWGLFINDVLIAETGTCYPRLENLVIPFSVPVGSQNVRIDIRWKTITTNALTVTSVDGNPTTKLEMFGAEILAKNTYR